MSNFWASFVIRTLFLIVSFLLTSIAGYIAYHQTTIKVAGRAIDLTAMIKSTIKDSTKWGVDYANTKEDWDGPEKQKYVKNLVKQALTRLPVPVTDPDKYDNLIDACIESTLAGVKLANEEAKVQEEQESSEVATDQVNSNQLPQQAKIEGEVVAPTNDDSGHVPAVGDSNVQA